MSGHNLDSDDEITGINIAPMVDIMLVLLIIFMVTSSMIVNKTIKVELPEAASGEKSAQEDVLSFAINSDEELFLNKRKITFDSVIKEIQGFTKQNANSKLSALISADQSVDHGTVVRLIDFVRRAGIQEFALDVKEPLK